MTGNESDIKIPRNKSTWQEYVMVVNAIGMGLGFIIIMAALLFGCSAVEPYVGDAKGPFLKEVLDPAPRAFGHGHDPSAIWTAQRTKTVRIANPHDRNIRVFVDCGMSSEHDLIIAPRTICRTMETTNEFHAYDPVCQLVNWSFTNAEPTCK